MIITSTSGKSWILPKGHPEDNLNNAQVAELETYEEAGIKGVIFDRKFRKELKRKEDSTIIIYPLLIKKILDKWPEDSKRKRRLVTIKEALSLVTNKEHIGAIRYFSTTGMTSKLNKAITNF
ncbi:MAG: hypothetical protein KZQ70_12015 [gamma proteobacterium symbiont of Lucinoma myriamae]|nr:hypothetical protein [gamma proteobacterium symbiont of Lucinoma myriamae]MCU7817593.1 hypothetical protein [gamma proteobacterium symbiont of Lucinoma myriamae]